MDPTAFWWSLACVLAVAGTSLCASRLYRAELGIGSGLMSVVSFLPMFVFAIVSLPGLAWDLPIRSLVVIFVKNVFYALSFYYRYESLRAFGPFIGALMLGTQPLFLSFMAYTVLNEALAPAQWGGIVGASIGLFLLNLKPRRPEDRVGAGAFLLYYLLPMLASTAAMVCDRYFLKGQVGGMDYFLIDKVLLLPAALLTLLPLCALSGEKLFDRSILARRRRELVLIGLLFFISSLAYTFALKHERAALVGLFRNASYPLAAFIGVFAFRQQISRRQWASLALVCASIAIAAFR
jgi:drug/metabolite transporter (DMT)-like permease